MLQQLCAAHSGALRSALVLCERRVLRSGSASAWTTWYVSPHLSAHPPSHCISNPASAPAAHHPWLSFPSSPPAPDILPHPTVGPQAQGRLVGGHRLCRAEAAAGAAPPGAALQHLSAILLGTTDADRIPGERGRGPTERGLGHANGGLERALSGRRKHKWQRTRPAARMRELMATLQLVKLLRIDQHSLSACSPLRPSLPVELRLRRCWRMSCRGS